MNIHHKRSTNKQGGSLMISLPLSFRRASGLKPGEEVIMIQIYDVLIISTANKGFEYIEEIMKNSQSINLFTNAKTKKK